MIAARRAPGAKQASTKTPKVKTPKAPKVPRERKRRVAALRAKLAHRRARRRQPPPAPADLRKREMIAVTTVAVAAVLAVTVIAAVISYSHMFDWAQVNHEPDWRARLFPLSVDGAILAASLVLYADSRAGRRADKLAYFITFAGIGWSVGANIGHTWVSDLAAKMIAGWPPIAMALSVELLFRFVRRWRGQADAEVRKAARRTSAPVAEPIAPAPAVVTGAVILPAQAVRVPKSPEPEPTPSAMPSWVPVGANTKQACMAYLAQHPNADGIEVDREVGQHFQMSDGYARKQVREHKARLAMLAEREG